MNLNIQNIDCYEQGHDSNEHNAVLYNTVSVTLVVHPSPLVSTSFWGSNTLPWDPVRVEEI
jgi:hypothetical protein